MNGHARPRVLLADDHLSMLSAASEVLAPDCEIVAALTDARRVLETALRLAPDVVVLDVAMPELDGFQIARELTRLGSSSEIVFLSMHRGEDYVGAGFSAGGHGYVLKTRMRSDLTSAVRHTLAGRIFVPSLSALSPLATAGGHAIQLHTDSNGAANEGGRLVGAALARGDAVIVYASPATRMAVSRWLAAHDVDVAGVGDRYRETDPSEFLQQVMRDGRPSIDSVAAIVEACDAVRIAAAGPASRLTIL